MSEPTTQALPIRLPHRTPAHLTQLSQPVQNPNGRPTLDPAGDFQFLARVILGVEDNQLPGWFALNRQQRTGIV